jgi:hypothetical protein
MFSGLLVDVILRKWGRALLYKVIIIIADFKLIRSIHLLLPRLKIIVMVIHFLSLKIIIKKLEGF